MGELADKSKFSKLPNSKLGTILHPKADLTFKLIDGGVIENVSLKQSLLNGSILRNSRLKNVDFSRCDLEGVRIEGSKFQNVDFSNVDLKSTILSNCDFFQCMFEDAYISDCHIVNSSFTECSFVRGYFGDSYIEKGVFKANDLTGSSFLLNRFYQTLFEEMILGDCSFYHQIMKNCRFQSVTINADAIGSLYGISHDDLRSFKFLFLGERTESPSPTNILEQLNEQYEDRGWLFAKIILDLNFARTSILKAIRRYIDVLISSMRDDILVRKEDVMFFLMILHELKNEQRLPLFSIYELLANFDLIRDELSEVVAYQKAQSSLFLLHNEAYVTFRDMVEDLAFACEPLLSVDQDIPIKLKLTLKHPPKVNISHLLLNLGQSSGLPISGNSKLIQTFKGSYIEVVQTTLFTIFALQIFLMGINGSLMQIIKIKSNFKILINDEREANFRNNMLTRRESHTGLLTPLKNTMEYIKNNISDEQQFNEALSPENLNQAEILELFDELEP